MKKGLETKTKCEYPIDFEKLIEKLSEIPGENWSLQIEREGNYYVYNMPFGEIKFGTSNPRFGGYNNYGNLLIVSSLGDKIYESKSNFQNLVDKIKDERK